MANIQIEGTRWMVEVVPGCIFIRSQQTRNSCSWMMDRDATVTELDALISALEWARTGLIRAGI